MNIEKLVQEIKDVYESGYVDNEVLHGMEDDLLYIFIGMLAERQDDIGDYARLILTVRDLDFERWYA